jgi:hypothetical protein
MMLIHQKLNLKFYLKNDYFNNHDIINVLVKILNEGFFEKKDRAYVNKNNTISSWAFDFRIPLLNSENTRILFPCISKYLSEIGETNIGLYGFGSFPFIGLSQYENIKRILLLRKEQKNYGFKQNIEGILPYDEHIIEAQDQKDFNFKYVNAEGNICSQYKKICIIDDICNTGNSMNNAEKILYRNNYIVSSYFSLVNYAWSQKNINIEKLHSIIEIHKIK